MSKIFKLLKTSFDYFLGQQPKLAQISTTNTSGGHQNSNKGGPADNLVVLFSESARCHFCNVLCPDRATLKAHLEDTHQPPRHALCENCKYYLVFMHFIIF